MAKQLEKDIKATKKSMKETSKAAVEAGKDIVKNAGEAVSEIGNIAEHVGKGLSKISLKQNFENAKTQVQLKNNAILAQAALQGLIEKNDLAAEKQRQIRDNDLINIEDRIKANELLKQKLEEQEKLMLENVKAIQDAAQAQFDLTGKDEDYIALLEAKNEVKAVEAQIEGFMSEQESNRVALQKEKIELAQSETDATAERQIAERNFNAEMMENDVLRLQAQQSNAIKEKELEEKRLKDKRDSYQAGTQAFQDAQNELDAYSEESARNQVKIQKDLDKAKEQQMTQTLGNLATIVGANSKFGKAIAIVSAIRDTYAGATKALAQGGIFGFIGAAAVIAGGIANVKQITSTPEPEPPAGATSGGAMAVPPTPSMPPAFNIVGQGETSQLADEIGTQAQEPVRAYVVSNDVTTAQGRERNIVEGASI